MSAPKPLYPAQPPIAEVKEDKDYVAESYGEYPSPWMAQIRSLRWAIDDTSAAFGDDVYDRMALDPIVASTLMIFNAAILEDGLLMASPVKDPKDPEAALADEILAAANQMIEDLDTPLDSVLWDMMKMVHLGNRVAELIWTLKERPDGFYKESITAIKVKPRRAIAFVMDPYGNLLGLQAVIPGQPMVPRPGSTVDPKAPLLPLSKFLIFSFRPSESDPRGSSILRPAFNTWVDKIQTLAERQKHLARYASPSIFGTTADKAQPVDIVDTQGVATGKRMNPQEAMKQALLALHSGTVTVGPFGSNVALVEAKGDGTVFANALSYDDSQIVKTILTQTLATGEGQHGSTRAAARVHQDSFNTLVKQAKKAVATSLRDGLLKVWVSKNWGDQAIHLTPNITMGSSETQDLASLMAAVARLFTSGYVAKSQLPSIDSLLNLPERLADEIETTNPGGVQPVGNPGGIKGPDAKPEA